eukprot:2526027-Pleurochrysis_carterae.AAC.2
MCRKHGRLLKSDPRHKLYIHHLFSPCDRTFSQTAPSTDALELECGPLRTKAKYGPPLVKIQVREEPRKGKSNAAERTFYANRNLLPIKC